MSATSWLYELDGGATETFYVPMRRVEVGPSPGALKAVADVTTVTYKDAINQIDSFEFTINGGAWAPGTARYADRLPGQPPDQLLLVATRVSVTVSGTPAAVPLALPMLLRMSLRMMPLSASALATPLLLLLVPSPG